MSDLGDYCRAVETHLCQVNGGHLVRIAGPAFATVKGWFEAGVPLSIVKRGVDRRAARAARAKTGTRRPLRIEFCEADVMDVLDEWRRAVGFALGRGAEAKAEEADEAADRASADAPADTSPEAAPRGRTASLTRHLERVSLRLSSFLASVKAADDLRASVERWLAEIGDMQGKGRVRGEARADVLARLAAMDDELLDVVDRHAPAEVRSAAREDAMRDLEQYRGRLPAPEYEALVSRVARRDARSRLELPEFRLE